MTKLLEQAFAEAAKLPPEAQDALAQLLLEDLKGERRWDRSFGPSESDRLAALADEALEEHRSGTTRDLDPSEL